MSEALTRAQLLMFLGSTALKGSEAGDIMAHDAALRQEIERLEQALRLHLAVSPDDPVLITPVEQQLVAMRQERDKRDIEAGLYCAKWEEAQATLARVEGELAERPTRKWEHSLQMKIRQQNEHLAQAEQREARLREALELIATTNHGNYPDNATPYEIGIADGHRCAAKWAQQALSPQEPHDGQSLEK